MKRLRVILLLLLLSIAGAAVASYQTYRRFSALSRGTARVDSAQREIILLAQISAGVKDLLRYERGYAISRGGNYYPPQIESSITALHATTHSLQSFYPRGSQLYSRIVTLRADVARCIALLRSSLRSTDSASRSSELLYQENRRVAADVFTQLDGLRARAAHALELRLRDRHTYSDQTRSRLRALLLFFGILTAILFASLFIEVRRNLRTSRRLARELAENHNHQREIGEIAYAVNHHLQEPLRKMQIFSDRLQTRGAADATSTSTPDALRDDLARLTSAAHNAQALVADLAGFTALSAASRNAMEMVSLAEILEQSISRLEERIPDIGATVHATALPTVNGIATELVQLFYAILDNAIKFASAERAPRVEVTSAPTSGQTIGQGRRGFFAVSIQDNGIGFEPEYTKTVFKLFSRLHSNSQVYSGKGLGLALVRRIMESHNGFAYAHAEPDKGTRITLYFPMTESR